MATIAGILTIPGSGWPYTGKFRVQMVDAPKSVGAGQTGTGIPAFIQCDETGAYSFTLPTGSYTVNIPNTRCFLIAVPPGSGTYDLDDLIVDAPTGQEHYFTIIETMTGIPGVEALRLIDASQRHADQVVTTMWAYAEDDGQEIFYRWDEDNTEEDNGISVVRPDDVEAGEAGRWIRMAHQ